MKKDIVKYALLPVKETRINEKGEDYFSTVGYIVSKAFVEEEYIKEKEDGSVNTTYKICFPYTVLDNRINYLRRTPESPLVRSNEAVVSKLYDNYDDAVAEKEERNILVSEHLTDKYNEIEKELLELTNDLEVINIKTKTKKFK